ncbi:hypothetical protein ES702_07197 [subsurface metagenome]
MKLEIVAILELRNSWLNRSQRPQWLFSDTGQVFALIENEDIPGSITLRPEPKKRIIYSITEG